MGRLQRKKSPAKKKKTVDAPVAVAEDAKDLASKTKSTPPARPQRKKSVAAEPEKENFVTRSMQFLREVKVELKRVTWPSRKQTIGSTVVVLFVVMVVSLFLGAVDAGLSGLIRLVLN